MIYIKKFSEKDNTVFMLRFVIVIIKLVIVIVTSTRSLITNSSSLLQFVQSSPRLIAY